MWAHGYQPSGRWEKLVCEWLRGGAPMCAVMNSDRGLAVAGYVWFHSELQFLFRLTDLFFFFFSKSPPDICQICRHYRGYDDGSDVGYVRGTRLQAR